MAIDFVVETVSRIWSPYVPDLQSAPHPDRRRPRDLRDRGGRRRPAVAADRALEAHLLSREAGQVDRPLRVAVVQLRPHQRGGDRRDRSAQPHAPRPGHHRDDPRRAS